MASKLASMKKVLRCPVCHDILNKAKLLRCSHRLCRECLHGLIMSKDTRTAHVVQCPCCRKEENIIDMVDGKPKEEWVDIFTDDFMLTAIVEKLQSIDTCEKHSEEPVWMYCIECEVPLCQVCYRVDHKDHQTGSLEVKAEERRSFYKDLLDSCYRTLDEIEKGTSHSPNVEQIATHYKNASKSIDQEYRRIQDLLKEMEKKSKSVIKERFQNEFLKCISSEKKQKQTLLAKLEEICSNTSDAAVLEKNCMEEISKLNSSQPLEPQALAGSVTKPVNLLSLRKLLAKITPGITISFERDLPGNSVYTAPTQQDKNIQAPNKGRKRKRESKFDYESPTPSTSSGSPCPNSSD